MKTKTVADMIRHLRPCEPAVRWAANYTDPVKAWQECRHGSWMLWLLSMQLQAPTWSDQRKPFVACCLDCAETAKHLWKDPRISVAAAVMRRWIDGNATATETKKARELLSTIMCINDDDILAVNAIDAVWAAADGAAIARTTAEATAEAADAVSILECANIVRQHYPQPPEI